MELPVVKQEKVKLTEINEILSCSICKGYLVDATTISECLHSFCRSCIVNFLYTEDHSYCPKCEVIINKAKPNLKLDKILQDVVYKLVPGLFPNEMGRRQEFYSGHRPDVVARIAPEDRGDDTERTIFSPQEQISLSLEYISEDDDPPSEIPLIQKILNKMQRKYENKTEEEVDTTTATREATTEMRNEHDAEEKDEENNQDSQMKTFLLCPGMCRVEVLKKFLCNKYNVDTNQFYIDILYKRVPLPGHYTLIDIAYIYSYQRNELMRFFFSIIDRKATKSPDNNNPLTPYNFMKMCTKANKNNNKIIVPNDSHRKKETISKKKSLGKSYCKSNKQIIEDEKTKEDNEMIKGEMIKKSKEQEQEDKAKLYDFEIDDEKMDNKIDRIKKEKNNFDGRIDSLYENNGIMNQSIIDSSNRKQQFLKVPKNSSDTVIKVDRPSDLYVDRIIVNNDDDDKQNESVLTTKMENDIKCESTLSSTSSRFKIEPVSPTDVLPSTNNNKSKRNILITLKRSENIEIITQIKQISNENGLKIGHHIKRTIKKGHSNNSDNNSGDTVNNNSSIKVKNSSKKSPTNKNHTKETLNKKVSKTDTKIEQITTNNSSNSSSNSLDEFVVKRRRKNPEQKQSDIDDEKSRFFQSIELKAVDNSSQNHQPMKSVKKRKSPTAGKLNTKPKNQQAKKSKTTQPQRSKSKPSSTIVCPQQQKNNLQSIINSCNLNIPSSLSITIKSSSDSHTSTPVARPVKNFIEILKLPDDTDKEKVANSCTSSTTSGSSSTNTSTSSNTSLESNDSTSRLCLSKLNEDSEQKVDQELSEIARSLTEKIPMSTTISPIVGGSKTPQFQIPVQTTSNELHVTLLPELGSKSMESSPPSPPVQPTPPPPPSSMEKEQEKEHVDVVAKPIAPISDEKSSSKTQSFQKIFEESIKKNQDKSSENTNDNQQKPITDGQLNNPNSTVKLPVTTTSSTITTTNTNPTVTINKEERLFNTDAVRFVPHEAQPKNANVETKPKAKKHRLEQPSSDGKKRMKLLDAKLKRLDLLKKKKKNELLLPKVPIARLNTNIKLQKSASQSKQNEEFSQTTANLRSLSLGMNYTVSVSQNNPMKFPNGNGSGGDGGGSIMTATLADATPSTLSISSEYKLPVSPLTEIKPIQTEFKVPSVSFGSPKLPVEVPSTTATTSTAISINTISSTKCSSSSTINTTASSDSTTTSTSACSTTKAQVSPKQKTSPKSSPVVKHMFAQSGLNDKLPSPLNLSPKSQRSPVSPKKSGSTRTSPTTGGNPLQPSPPNLVIPPTIISTSNSQQDSQQEMLQQLLQSYNLLNSSLMAATPNGLAYQYETWKQIQHLLLQQQQQQQIIMPNRSMEINNGLNNHNRLSNTFLTRDKCIQNFNGPLNNGRS